MSTTLTPNVSPDWMRLAKITLDQGGHTDPNAGMCAMEAVAFITGEPFSDHPRCVSPVIAAFCRSWNDTLSTEDRNRLLKPMLPKVVGTATTAEDEEIRAWMATDWLARTCAPAWLRLAGLTEHAQALESLARIVDAITAESAQPTLDAALHAARRAAWSAAESAARRAAWSAARRAARRAARSAAESAAESAARSATRSAAWSAAWSAAESAARSAARSAAESAARSEARSAARSAAWSAAESAAWSAAWSALAPTVFALQTSALELLAAMCEVGRTPATAAAPGAADNNQVHGDNA